jgi:hypothetical protein
MPRPSQEGAKIGLPMSRVGSTEYYLSHHLESRTKHSLFFVLSYCILGLWSIYVSSMRDSCPAVAFPILPFCPASVDPSALQPQVLTRFRFRLSPERGNSMLRGLPSIHSYRFKFRSRPTSNSLHVLKGCIPCFPLQSISRDRIASSLNTIPL